MKTTKLFGYSDDLIEVEGRLNEEINHYSERAKGFEFSDGTKGKIKYDDGGIWRIEVSHIGGAMMRIVKSEGDDFKHIDNDAKDCSGYSDVLIMDDTIDWVKIGRKTIND